MESSSEVKATKQREKQALLAEAEALYPFGKNIEGLGRQEQLHYEGLALLFYLFELSDSDAGDVFQQAAARIASSGSGRSKERNVLNAMAGHLGGVKDSETFYNNVGRFYSWKRVARIQHAYRHAFDSAVKGKLELKGVAAVLGERGGVAVEDLPAWLWQCLAALCWINEKSTSVHSTTSGLVLPARTVHERIKDFKVKGEYVCNMPEAIEAFLNIRSKEDAREFKSRYLEEGNADELLEELDRFRAISRKYRMGTLDSKDIQKLRSYQFAFNSSKSQLLACLYSEISVIPERKGAGESLGEEAVPVEIGFREGEVDPAKLQGVLRSLKEKHELTGREWSVLSGIRHSTVTGLLRGDLKVHLEQFYRLLFPLGYRFALTGETLVLLYESSKDKTRTLPTGPKPEPCTSFGMYVRKERKRHGWTQRELAEKIGSTQEYISSIELGGKTPSEQYVEILEKVLEEPSSG